MNNELNRAIATAKKAHDHNDGPADATAISIGALIRAVEILADQLKDEHVGTYHPPTIAEIKTQDEPGARTHDPAPNTTPAPNLVERLTKAYVFAEMEAIAGGGDPVDMGVRAIFAELAKRPVELPSEEQIRIASYDIGNADGVMTLEAAGQRVATLFRERLTPILAAKDAEREALNKVCLDAVSAAASAEHRLDLAKERIVELEKQRDDERGLSNLRAQEIDTWKNELGEARVKIYELEKEVTRQQGVIRSQNKTMEDHVSRGVHESMVADLRAKVDGFEQSIAVPASTVTGNPQPVNSDTTGVEPDWIVERVRSAIKSSYEDLELLKGPFLAVSFRDMAERAIAELRRIDKERELVTIDGKTPGQVLHDEWSNGWRAIGQDPPHTWATLSDGGRDIRERAAQAVLRAFGQPSQTQQDAAEALRRVRERVGGIIIEAANDAWYAFGNHIRNDALAFIDDELAKLSAGPSRDVTTPKFFANDNELRGSYFCTAITLRPYLHVGHDIEFDDIPRILKLSRNDIIEVRVVERAKQ